MTLKFGELEKVAVDDGFIWYTQLELKSESFGEVPFCLVCKDETGVDDETILLVERIAQNIDRYIKGALGFLKDELRRAYSLSKDELRLLDVSVCDLSYKFEIYRPFGCEFRSTGGFKICRLCVAAVAWILVFTNFLDVQNHNFFSHFWLD